MNIDTFNKELTELGYAEISLHIHTKAFIETSRRDGLTKARRRREASLARLRAMFEHAMGYEPPSFADAPGVAADARERRSLARHHVQLTLDIVQRKNPSPAQLERAKHHALEALAQLSPPIPTGCKLCGTDVAYSGALFCGGACSQLWESGERP